MRNRILQKLFVGIALPTFLNLGNAQTASTAGTPANSRAPIAATAPTSVPALVPFSATAVDDKGNPLKGETAATFLIYKDQLGGEPLFSESQVISLDEFGRYSVQLGASNPNGLPTDLFSTGEARWLGVQIAGRQPEPRVLLASVPYALKAADSATLGGLPASAFALAGSNAMPSSATSAAISPDTATTVTTTGGTANKVAKFSGTNTIVNSILYDNGTDVGIGTTAPTATLTVDGTMTIDGASTLNGQLQLSAEGTATASKAYNSEAIKLATSAYNSSSKSVVPPRFQLQAETTGNNTASPGATLNLLASTTSSSPAETGLYFNTNGTIHFASGQTFPGGSGSGTITGVTAGTGLTGGGTSGNVTLNLNTGLIPTLAGNNTFTGSNIFNASLYENTDVNIDNTNANSGNISPGLRLGQASGEGMASRRTSGGNQYGVDIYTNYSPRLSINAAGQVAIGTGATFNGAQLQVQSSSGVGGNFTGGTNSDGYGDGAVGVTASGGSVSGDSDFGGDGGDFYGGGASGSDGAYGGAGITAFGGESDPSDAASGDGGAFYAGVSANGRGGYGIYVEAARNANGEFIGSPAASLEGDVSIDGTLTADTKYFKIDHPSDPANKYLVHASVESSEMVNIYSGNVTTDELGLATVKLPDWFEAENVDFRYQLTVLDERFAQAGVSKKIQNHQFTIHTNASHVEVSWQVTGVRQDAYARAHPLVVEQTKNARERGFYRHPELYGQPAEKQIEWGRNPELMRQLKSMREAQKNRAKAVHSMTTGDGKSIRATAQGAIAMPAAKNADATP